MSYDLVDEPLREWCSEHTLYLSTEDRGYEVRTTDVVDKYGNVYRIWLNRPDEKGEVHLFACEQKFRSPVTEIVVPVAKIRDGLDRVWDTVQAMIKKAEATGKPAKS